MTQIKKRTTVDLDVVRQLADVLAEANLTEIEYQNADCRVRVARMASAPAAAALIPAPAPVSAGAVAAPGGTEAEAFAGHPGLLTSPMVGVVYVAPEPGAAPFVKVGDSVSLGDTVLLIEAMKVFNPIKAHCSGRIERIFVAGGLPVEYGEPLLLIV
jgi:acetyl-CoA carboxylase biotin carboxyl carrier protein